MVFNQYYFRFFITLFLLLISIPSGFTQTPKGAIALNSSVEASGITRALIVGISDYQDPQIPDLHYADKDAKAFADYLQSKAGGNVSSENIRLLTNEQATAGQFGSGLDWLLDVSKDEDKVVIYFSGHGDVEKRLIDQPGYLLMWDSPANSYMVGAFALNHFQQIISTLSIVNKCKTYVILDACRAGKLAGSSVQGTQLTTANLARQYANEIKILSCQPEEFSIEGPQWGGGRGAFSFHLIDALYGMADNNQDLFVNLSEIDRYLEDHVTPEVAPINQSPITVGNKMEKIARVDLEFLEKIKDEKSKNLPVFSQIEQKILETSLLNNLDSNALNLYAAFESALSKKAFFEPKGQCAIDLYELIIQDERFGTLHQAVKRNLAAALQDDAQQVLNRMIFYPSKEIRYWYSPARVRDMYGDYPKMLEYAATLLGENHYMYPVLMARKYLFEGAIIYLQKIYWKDPISGRLAIEKFLHSLRWQKNAAHTYYLMGLSYYYNLGNRDSAFLYLEKAHEFAPNWILPITWKNMMYSSDRDFKIAKPTLDSLYKRDSLNISVLEAKATYELYSGQFETSYRTVQKALSIDSSDFMLLGNNILLLGFLGRKEEAIQTYKSILPEDSTSGFPHYFLGNMYYLTGDYTNAIKYFGLARKHDPSMIWAYSQEGDALIILKEYEQARDILLEGVQKDSTYMPLTNALGGAYKGLANLQKASEYYKKATLLDQHNPIPYYNLASTLNLLGKTQEALNSLEKALQIGMKSYRDSILSDSDWNSIRDSEDFKALIKRYLDD